MNTPINQFPELVRRNLRDFRKKAGLTHQQVAEQLAPLVGCKPGHTQSQANETGDSLPYLRLAALAQIFDTDPAQFFMEIPTDLMAHRDPAIQRAISQDISVEQAMGVSDGPA